MRIWHLCLIVLCLTAFTAPASAQEALPTYTIASVFDGPGRLNDDILNTIQSEAEALLGREFEVVFPAAHTLTGDWSVTSIDSLIDVVLADDEADMVLTLGGIGTYRVSRRGLLSKPVIAPFAIDIDWQGLPFEGPGSGVENLNYLVSLPDFRRGLESLKRIQPYETVAVLIYQPYFDAFPIRPERVQMVERLFDCNLMHLPIGNTAASAMAVVGDTVDAAYIMPLVFGWEPAAIADLADSLIDRGIASFSYIGRNEVELGMLAGLGPATDWTRLARRVSLNIQRILLGERPQDLPVDFSRESQLVINMETARQIGVYPNWAVMTEAAYLLRRVPKGLELLMRFCDTAVEIADPGPDA